VSGAERVRLEVDLPSGAGRALALVSLDCIGVAYGSTGTIAHQQGLSVAELRAVARDAAELADWLAGGAA
jgi:hypothetical protein